MGWVTRADRLDTLAADIAKRGTVLPSGHLHPALKGDPRAAGRSYALARVDAAAGRLEEA